MVDVTRRGFLAQVSVATGVGLAGGLGLHKLLAASSSSASVEVVQPMRPVQAMLPEMDQVSLAGPMLIHVRDFASGEIAMMVGTQELVYRDPELVSGLVRRAASAGNAGA
jgi:hypothetical protein